MLVSKAGTKRGKESDNMTDKMRGVGGLSQPGFNHGTTYGMLQLFVTYQLPLGPVPLLLNLLPSLFMFKASHS